VNLLTLTDTAVPTAKRTTSRIGWVALGLAILGFILAVIPGVSVFAIVSIVAVAKKNVAKTVPVISLILSVLAGIVAIIVSIVTALAVVSSVASTVADDTTTTIDEATGGIGQAVTTEEGIAFTVDAVTCALPTYTSLFGTDETALGQFCELQFTVVNNGDKEAGIFPNYVGGLIGTTEFAADSMLSSFADGSGAVTLNPGLSTSGVAIVDIPVDQALEAVTFTDGLFSGDIAVLVK
jgi:nitrogen fixation/metabolism regulation signal transduction histidine kinase